MSPQTVIDAGEDLKTAFFLTDSAFGPLPPEPVVPPPSPNRIEPPRPGPAAGPLPPADDRHEPRAATTAIALPLRPEVGALDGFLTDPAPAVEPEPEPTVIAATEARRRPLRDTGPLAPEPAESAIDYFAPRRARSRSLGLALSPSAWVAALALAALLAGQALVGWRDPIAARAPWAAPILAVVVSPLGLSVGPPRDIEALTIESFELQATSTPNRLQLRAVLSNRSGHRVRFPALELTLTDSAGQVLVRKVIPPEDYSADPGAVATGLGARSEWPLRLGLEHGGLQPTGFSAALFYP